MAALNPKPAMTMEAVGLIILASQEPGQKRQTDRTRPKKQASQAHEDWYYPNLFIQSALIGSYESEIQNL